MPIHRVRILFLASLIGAAASAALVAAGAPASERYVANAISIASPGPTGAAVVEISVDRWSTEAEHNRLVNTLIEQGQEKLLDTLRDLPRAGFIRTPGNLGYDLRYARKEPIEEGGERIVIATDRPISFWEAANRPRTIDYPFTLIEIRLPKEGKGEGKMAVATKISFDKKKNTVELENYSSEPVRLQEVRIQK